MNIQKIAGLLLLAVAITGNANHIVAMDDYNGPTGPVRLLKNRFENKLMLNGKEVTIISRYDLKPYEPEIQQALTATNTGMYNVRDLEKIYELLQENNQSFFKRHRGKLAFGAGALISAPLFVGLLIAGVNLSDNLRELYFQLLNCL